MEWRELFLHRRNGTIGWEPICAKSFARNGGWNGESYFYTLGTLQLVGSQFLLSRLLGTADGMARGIFEVLHEKFWKEKVAARSCWYLVREKTAEERLEVSYIF